MAKRGHAEIVGCDRAGNWIIRPDRLAIDVLLDAKRIGVEVEIRATVPTRGTRRKFLTGGLKLTR